MTLEEAITILDPETRRETRRKIPVMDRIAADQEACRIAVAALAQANAKLEAAARDEKRGVIAADRDLAQFEVLFSQAQEIANKLHGLLLKARGKEDGGQAAGMQKALADLIGKAARV